MEASTGALLFSCAPIVVGALIVAGALYYWRQGRELRASGVTARATVVAKHRQRSGNVYVMRFADTDGSPRTVEVRVRSTRGGAIAEGSTVPVTYVPAHPETAALGLKWGAHIEGWLALLVAACGGGMVVHGLHLVFGVVTGRLEP